MFNVFTERVHKLKQCTKLILHDENYTSFAVSVLVRGTYFKFWPTGGALIRRGRLLEGGADSRIYGITLMITDRIGLHSVLLPLLSMSSSVSTRILSIKPSRKETKTFGATSKLNTEL